MIYECLCFFYVALVSLWYNTHDSEREREKKEKKEKKNYSQSSSRTAGGVMGVVGSSSPSLVCLSV